MGMRVIGLLAFSSAGGGLPINTTIFNNDTLAAEDPKQRGSIGYFVFILHAFQTFCLGIPLLLPLLPLLLLPLPVSYTHLTLPTNREV